MTLKGKAILITGGSSGIGLELARLCIEEGMKVHICGREQVKLSIAKEILPTIITHSCDVTNEAELFELVNKLKADAGVDILVNNAGKEHIYELTDEKADAYKFAFSEMQTNYLASVRLSQMILPVLLKKRESAIVNTISILAYQPMIKSATYSASKAALHSYSRSLRVALKNTPVKVFAVYPPGVNTELSKDLKANKIEPREVAGKIISGLKNNRYDIRIGITRLFYYSQKLFPNTFFILLNKVFIKN